MRAKVIIEITPEGWTKTVEVGNEAHIERWRRTRFGAEAFEGNFEDDPKIDDRLYRALQTVDLLDINIALMCRAQNIPTPEPPILADRLFRRGTTDVGYESK